VIRIRPARADEAPAILELWIVGQTTSSSTDSVASILDLLRHDPDALLVAESDGRLVGTLIAGWDGWRVPARRRPRPAPDRHRDQLVRAAEDRFRELGARRVAAVVMTEHPHANGFWLSMGYELDGRVSRYVRNLTVGPYT
jgi:ribosomal protein S18 acetylase RimI-like enzyme